MSNANEPAHHLKQNERIEDPTTGCITINESEYCYTGLTKREYFAGLAMQGMLSSDYSGEFMGEINDNTNDRPNGLADNAIRYADALLKQLGEQNEQN